MSFPVPRHPPFDPALAPALEMIRAMTPPQLLVEDLPALRERDRTAQTLKHIRTRGLVTRDMTLPGHNGAELSTTVISRGDRNHRPTGPGIYFLHGGGMVSGRRLDAVEFMIQWVLDHDAVLVTPDYRLAPEHPAPTPVEDCYAGLVWMHEHAATLNVDSTRILIGGTSAGGGLAAGTALLARDRNGPELLGQILMSPMLDDRNTTTSSQQIDGTGVWDRGDNRFGWTCLLGDRRGTEDVSVYSAPGRAVDTTDGLAGLPPTFIDCGSAEVFRDENVAYASGLWAAGIQAELHVWAGAFHGSAMMVPDTAVSRSALEARDSWVARLLSPRL
ncbi:Apha/beta hydrolase domain-containing protein [Corynebacterium glyciniphilum AJ 3170]|uniref:Apha/beta hydrolase domain-containing protein n=1 Tax=Corynebacterium glyciniphilum AJ 3170 TaxID=1404245 RepID=X5DXF0_9CORY|nr:alpha/beta hydrolase [Corynebacterium glyciniphilum]AHW65267.1 Apha/beta hydrolase domain-containing protein [Corynebacterium glyciniphilum AJ 3170]